MRNIDGDWANLFAMETMQLINSDAAIVLTCLPFYAVCYF